MGAGSVLWSAGLLALCCAAQAFVSTRHNVNLPAARAVRTCAVRPASGVQHGARSQRRVRSVPALHMGPADDERLSLRRTAPTGITVGIPKETQFGAVQVAATPKAVGMLTKSCGYSVVVESGAGAAAGYSDEQYMAAGAQLVDTAASAWAADIVFKVNAPHLEEVELAAKGSMVISYFPPSQKPELMEKLRAKRLAIIAMNNPRLPRTISRTQTFDALFFMANIAGYRGVVEAANAFGRYFSGQQVTGRNEPSYDLSSLESSLQAQASETPRQRSVDFSASAPKKVAIIGSGNWGSAMAKIVGKNCARLSHLDTEVRMWVYEEEVDGRKLSAIINEQNENVKYLPGIKLPANVKAVPDIRDATFDANVLVFVLPHQFLGALCSQIRDVVAPDCIGVSLIKGVHFDESGIVLISDLIKQDMQGMDVSVLMGANLANEVAEGAFSESTIGYSDPENGQLLRSIFHDPNFQVNTVPDIPGVEVCGALKNVVALGAGFVDGLGLGDNSKAAIIRIGLMEMKRFTQYYFKGAKDSTFFESCGVADLIVTCYGGRNRRCAEAFVRAGGTKTFEDVEAELMNGQKIQGTGTCQEVMKILKRSNLEAEYPLLTSIYKIAFEKESPETMIQFLGEVS